MSLSRVQYPGDGSKDLYSVTFPYISKAYVEVRVGGTPLVDGTGYVWNSASAIRLLSGNLPAGIVLDIRRNTPKTTKLVDFNDGSIVDEATLDLANDQTFHLVQEATDDVSDRMAVVADGTFEGQSRRIKNVADPEALQDVVTKGYGDINYGAAAAASAEASALAAATSSSEGAGHASAALVSKDAAKVSEENAKLSEVAAAQSVLDSIAQANTRVPLTSPTGSASIPSGTTAQRDSTPSKGFFRFNDDLGKFEGHNGTGWGSVGGGARGGGSNEVFVETDAAVTNDYTISTGKNAMSAGPVTINTGVTVTVPSGSTWTIV